MSNQITGIIKGIKPIEMRGQYQIRGFLLDISSYNPQTGEMYENMLNLELFGDKCGILDQFQAGQRVNVFFNLKGSKDKQTGRWRWVNVSAWKIEHAQTQPQVQPQIQQPVPVQQNPMAPAQQPQANTYYQSNPTKTTVQMTPAPSIDEIADDDLLF